MNKIIRTGGKFTFALGLVLLIRYGTTPLYPGPVDIGAIFNAFYGMVLIIIGAYYGWD